MNAVSIQGLYAGYGRTQILHGIDFDAEGNAITAIIGANGSGKSTILKSIFGLCDVKSGTITANGKMITGTPTHKMANHHISYMAQRDNVFSELTVEENLIIAALEADLQTAYEVFPELTPFKTQTARTLSGGQRQLLAMAMMILRSPKIVLFDEPTASLSPKNAGIILDKIRQINLEFNNCTILVEQNVKRALEFCDVVYLLASGQIVYHGKPETLLADKNLASKYLGI